MKWSPKVRRYFKEKMLKQPKGLVVCEEQAASPLALPWCAACCSNPDIQSIPAWDVLWNGTLADTTIHFWATRKSFRSQHCPDSCLSDSDSPDPFCPKHPLILLVLVLPALIRVQDQICSVRNLLKRSSPCSAQDGLKSYSWPDRSCADQEWAIDRVPLRTSWIPSHPWPACCSACLHESPDSADSAQFSRLSLCKNDISSFWHGKPDQVPS